jgi:CRP-like cAMP-binding protein
MSTFFNCYHRDHYIYFHDERATYIFMVVSGRVNLGHYLDDGKEAVTAILTTAEFFGELALAGKEKQKGFARARESCTTCPLSPVAS